MSKGDARREAELENMEFEFAEALALARKDPKSAFIAEKSGRSRRVASDVDIVLFTLESKIARLRDLLGLPPQTFAISKGDPSRTDPATPTLTSWPPAPELPGSVFPLNPAELWQWLKHRGSDPGHIFAKVKCGGGKARQSEASSFWRLATVECAEGRVPARLTLSLMPLPDGPDAVAAIRKLDQALERVVSWCETAVNTQPKERPRLLLVNFTRSTRELQLTAR